MSKSVKSETPTARPRPQYFLKMPLGDSSVQPRLRITIVKKCENKVHTPNDAKFCLFFSPLMCNEVIQKHASHGSRIVFGVWSVGTSHTDQFFASWVILPLLPPPPFLLSIFSFITMEPCGSLKILTFLYSGFKDSIDGSTVDHP